MKRVALYARVSSDHQAEAQTIDSQIAALKARAEADGHRVMPDDVFVDDGFSGSTLLRPALEQLRDRVADGRVELLYVHSPDRLARRYAYQVVLLEELRGRGVEVVFLQAPTQQNAEDALLVQMQGMIAEYERAKILERTRRGRVHKARHGVLNVMSCAPYGYQYVRKSDDAPARFEIFLPEAKVVRRIFDALVIEGRSLYEIARMLTAEHVPTRKGLPRWDHGTLRGILNNPAYAGHAAYGRTEVKPRDPVLRLHRGQPSSPRAANSSHRRKPREEWISIPVPRIVSEEVYAAVQEQMDRNRRLRSGAHNARYLVSGLAVCARCGYAFHSAAGGSGRDKRLYYACHGTCAARFGGQRVCNNRPVPAQQLDDHVWRSVCEVLRDPARVLEEWSQRVAVDEDRAPLQVQRDEAKGVVDRLEARAQRLLDAYEIGAVSLDDLKARRAPLDERLQRARADLAAAEAELASALNLRAIATRLEDFAEQVAHGLEGLTQEQRRDVTRMLVARVEIDTDKISVVFRLPRSAGPSEPPTSSPTEPPSTPGRPPESYRVRGRRRGPSELGVWGEAPS